MKVDYNDIKYKLLILNSMMKEDTLYKIRVGASETVMNRNEVKSWIAIAMKKDENAPWQYLMQKCNAVHRQIMERK